MMAFHLHHIGNGMEEEVVESISERGRYPTETEIRSQTAPIHLIWLDSLQAFGCFVMEGDKRP